MQQRKTIAMRGLELREPNQIPENSKPSSIYLSIIVPAYNEAALLDDHLRILHSYMTNFERNFGWEILLVNDGSSDGTAEIADEFAEKNENVRVLHHPTNFGLGQALKFGFANTRGDYVMTLDVDLSYDVRHIEELLAKIEETRAKIVLASPYMKGGSINNVPGSRRMLSVLGNRFLKVFVKGHFSTLTSLVRIYDGPFIRSLDLRAEGMAVMPEIIHKAMVLRARVVEAPARLDWGPQLKYGQSRTSSMRVLKHVLSTILSGFIFRPFFFLVAPGMLVGTFAMYVNVWMFVHFIGAYRDLEAAGNSFAFTEAFASAFAAFPHTFIIGFLSSMVAIQLVGQGLLALQSKKYFEELFHLGSTHIRDMRQPVE